MTPAPDLFAFFHVWADGAWQQPVEDFLASVESNCLRPTGKYIGLVGTDENRAAVAAAMPGWKVITEATEGYTQVTLTALREFALAGNNGYVLYAHNKGAMNNTPFNAAWRRTMFKYCIEDWEDVVPLLDDYDAAGCFWMTPAEFPTMTFDPNLPAPRHFAGEVWWARLDWLRQLPPLRTDNRWQSEPWIAEGDNFRHYELGRHGWPASELFI